MSNEEHKQSILSQISSRFQKSFRRKNKYFQRRAFVFLIFLIFSFFLWFYNALEETYVAQIKVPVKYTNIPKNKILVNTPPKKLRLRVRSDGFTLLSNKIKIKKTLNFNVNSFLFHSQKDNWQQVFIPTKYALAEITEQLDNQNKNLQILSISPDTIFFEFTKNMVRTVPVVPNLINKDELLADQYLINGAIEVVPDSIQVSGPATLIDTITRIATKPLHLFQLDDSTSEKTGLLGFEGVKLSAKKVTVFIPVDRYTESGFSIPVHKLHVPDSIELVLFPPKVAVKYTAALSQIKKVSEADFHPFVDFNELLEDEFNTSQRAIIHLDTIPPYIHSVHIEPSSIQYLKEKN